MKKNSLFKFVSGLWILSVICAISALADVAFFGRNYETYKKMFCMSDDDLKERRILDVPAGPSTFLGTLKEKDWLHSESKAVDQGYGDVQKMKEALLNGMKQAFFPFFDLSYKSWPQERQAGFLAKYNEFNAIHAEFLEQFQTFPSLYVKGDIRYLSTVLGAVTKFDWVLSSNFLFLYSQREKDLDEEFHRKAILSLVDTVDEKGEIRIFPLDTLDAEVPKFLDHLLADLKKNPLSVEVRNGCAPSAGQLIKGRIHEKGLMLVIKKNVK